MAEEPWLLWRNENPTGTSHLPSMVFRLHLALSDHMFYDFSENALPASVGSAILHIYTTHTPSKNSLLRPRNKPDKANFGHGFRPYRFVARSFSRSSPPCFPSWTVFRNEASEPRNLGISKPRVASAGIAKRNQFMTGQPASVIRL